MEPFRIEGFWALDPESVFSKGILGTLEYSHEFGFLLTIPADSLGEPADSQSVFVHSEEAEALPLVYGFLQNGKKVTLLDVEDDGGKISIPGFSVKKYRASAGLVGSYFCPDLSFNQVVIEFLHLEKWVRGSLFTVERNRESFPKKYEITDPKQEILSAGDGWELLLSPVILTKQDPYEISSSVNSRLIFNFEDEVSLADLEDRYIDPLWQLISFFMNSTARMRSCKLKCQSQNDYLHLGKSLLPDAYPVGEFDKDVLLHMDEMERETLSGIINQWIDFNPDERHVSSLVVGLQGKWDMPIDLNFIAAAQGFEAMAYLGEDGLELADNEFQDRYMRTLNFIEDENLRKWCKRKLRYANRRDAEFYFRRLLDQITEYVDYLIPDRDKFIREFKANRNYYTHRTDKENRNILEWEELFILTYALKLILQAVLLRRLGFALEQITEIMQNRTKIGYMQRQVAAQYRLSS